MQRYIIPILMLTLMASASAIIESPQNTTYGPSVDIVLVSDEPSNLSYELGNESGGCTSCTRYEESIVLEDGTYTLNATDGNSSENITFSVLALRAFSTYENGILFASSNKNARLSYTVGDSDEVVLCESCSEANTTLGLEAGEHTISVFARLADEEANETYDVLIAEAFALTVTGPQNATYVRSAVLNVSTNHESTLTYTIDDETVVLCETCLQTDTILDLEAGHYTILIEAERDGETLSETVSFTITDFSVRIGNPRAETYTGDLPLSVLINVTASETLDSIEATLNGETYSCNSCEALTRTVSLGAGTYTLEALGTLTEETSSTNVTFTVSAHEAEEEPDDEPRFTTGLQHLPQAVERGEYTDSELASIIRENDLNPGVLNRLIRTGKLGDESIDAILETQFAPPGILWRLLGWIGIGRPSVPEAIAQNYDVSESQAQAIAVRPDTPPGLARQVVERAQSRGPPAANGWVPPGLARQNDASPSDTASDDEPNESDSQAQGARAIGSQQLPPGLRDGAPGNSGNAPGRNR